jgi:uncharacterized protein (TIGR03663 family)
MTTAKRRVLVKRAPAQEPPVMEAQEQVAVVRRPVVTIETAGYMGLALLAAALRLYQLGAAPLSAHEAGEAMAAWRLVHPGLAPPTPASPLLFGVMAFLFAIANASDGAARLLPALVGSALVLTPALFRQWLGRGGALMAAALLALSPSMIYASRLASSEVLALFCGVVLVAALLAALRSEDGRWLYIGAVALGLGLVSGPLIYSTLAVGLFTGLVLWPMASEEARANALAAYANARNTPGLLARLGATLAVTVFLGATALMAFPVGLGIAGDVLATWVAGFAGTRWIAYPVQLLALYEPMALVLGIGGLLLVEVRARQKGGGAGPGPALWPRILGLGALAALVLMLLRRGGTPGEVLLVVYPLALLAGPLVADVLEGLPEVQQRLAAWGLAAALILIAAISAIYLGLYAEQVGLSAEQASPRLLLALLLPLMGLALVALTVTWERSLWRPAVAVLIGLLTLYTLGTGWGLAQLRPNDPREPWVQQPTSEQVRMLVSVLEEASRQRVGMANELPVTVPQTGDDILAWYLRDFVNVTFTEQLGAQVTTPAVITVESEQPPTLGGAYAGTDFVLRTRLLPERPNETDWIRWLVIRSGMLAQPDVRVVLWVQAPASGQ